MSELYADDTTIHFSSNSISDINIKLNEDMEKVQEWCTSNDMVINTRKSNSMLMGSSSKIQYIESDFKIFYDDGLLNDVKYEKLLGITIDNCVSWCQQINNIVSKISSRLGSMCRLRTYLPTEGLIMYYNGYILPLFDYCCTVWGRNHKFESAKTM
jgi:predicted HAD superfamily hydrolase